MVLAAPMVAVQSLTPDRVVRDVPGVTLAEARKVVSRVHKNTPPGGDPFGSPIPHVRRLAIGELSSRTVHPTLERWSQRASLLDPFIKYAFRTQSSDVIETVRIPLEKAGRFSVCVSSQVGCALACAFCATGKIGLIRNLETWEIVEQVRIVRHDIITAGLGRVHGVVFQGMGEPLANLERVLDAIGVLTDPSALSIDGRNITVCTSGLPSGIRRLADEVPRVRLGLSIGSVKPDLRRRIMPIARAHDWTELMAAARYHATKTTLAPMWAYTLLAGINDGAEDAALLAEAVKTFAAETGIRPRLSLIPYNPIGADDPFRRTSDPDEALFRAELARHGSPSHKRYSGGSDVAAACGQLAGAG